MLQSVAMSTPEVVCPYCKGIHYSIQNAKRCEVRHAIDVAIAAGVLKLGGGVRGLNMGCPSLPCKPSGPCKVGPRPFPREQLR